MTSGLVGEDAGPTLGGGGSRPRRRGHKPNSTRFPLPLHHVVMSVWLAGMLASYLGPDHGAASWVGLGVAGAALVAWVPLLVADRRAARFVRWEDQHLVVRRRDGTMDFRSDRRPRLLRFLWWWRLACPDGGWLWFAPGRAHELDLVSGPWWGRDPRNR